MKRQPLLIMLLCFSLGILSQDYFSWDCIVAIVMLCSSAIAVGISYFKISFFVRFRYLFIGFIFCALGFIAQHINTNKTPSITVSGKYSEIVFQLHKKLNSNVKNRRYQIEVLDGQSNSVRFRQGFNSILNVPKDQPDLDFKHFYKAKVYLNRVDNPPYDFMFNYAKYLQRQNIFYQAYVPDGFLNVEKHKIRYGDQIKQKRLEVLWRINSSNLETRNKEFLKGIILADRTDMDDRVVQDFNQSGLVHLLAISGSHMVIIFWIILFALKPIFNVKNRNVPIIIALLLIWIFAIFIDYGSSVVRSCIMITVYYIMVILQRQPNLLHSVAVSAFVILLLDTQQIFDVGFQLSYLAVLGIYWLNPVLLKRFRKPKYVLEDFLYNIICISLSAQLATLPLVLFYFHQFSLVSIVANLVVLPFSEIIIIFSLLMVILFSINIEFLWLNHIYDYLIHKLLVVVHYFGTAQSFLIEHIGFGLLEVVLGLCSIYYLKFLIQKISYKTVNNFMIVFCLFIGLRIGLVFYNYQKDEVLSFNLFKESVLIVKNKEQVVFIINEFANVTSLKKSIIKPYLSDRRVDNYRIIKAREATGVVNYKGVSYKIIKDNN